MIGFYTFSFNNPERAERMYLRFRDEGIDLEFVDAVLDSDPRLINSDEKRTHSIMYNHLDMIKTFLDSKNDYGIFCEDDIHIRKGIKKYLPEIIAGFERRQLDVLLLGYLLPYKMTQIKSEFTLLGTQFTYHQFLDNLWGSQMYLLSRKSAQVIYDTFKDGKSESPFSPDWTITKFGSRALIYPMLGVEEGKVSTDHQGQIDFHKHCHDAQFDPREYN